MTAIYPPFDATSVGAAVAGSIGHPLVFLPEVDSTNRFARDLPPSELRHGMMIVTDFQTAGRGRRGRRWEAPPRTSLLCTVVLARPEGSFPNDLLSVCGLAVCDAIEEITGLATTLKWPNDVLVHGGKVCGLLAEALKSPFVAVGMGVNVNLPADTLAGHPEATALLALTGRPVSREHLFQSLVARLELWYGCVTRSPDLVFRRWSSRLSTVGQQVEVSQAVGKWKGRALSVGRDGALHVRDTTGHEHTLYAADVSVRGRHRDEQA